MIDLGFSNQEWSLAQRIVNKVGGWVPKEAKEIIGENLFNTKRDLVDAVKYAVSLASNDTFMDAYSELQSNSIFTDIPLDSLNILAKHYKKMSRWRSLGSYLYPSSFSPMCIREIITLAKCRNLEKPFDIYNDGHFLKGNEYKFIKKGKTESIIETTRHPYIETKDMMKNDQVKLKETERKDKDGNPLFEVRIKNAHIGLINRYAVLISLNPPSCEHCGMTVSLNKVGNVIYIYAMEYNNDKINLEKKILNSGGQFSKFMVLGYGFDGKLLETTLMNATNYIRKNINIALTIVVRPQMPFESKINWLEDMPEDFGSIDGDVEDNSGTIENPFD